jgi:hypothetical protein
MGRHTHQVVADQTVYMDAERPSHILLLVIPIADRHGIVVSLDVMVPMRRRPAGV